MNREKAAKIAKDIQKNWRLLDAIEVIEDLYPLALAHAVVYQLDHQLPSLHPVHLKITENAKQVLAKLKGGGE